MAKIVEGDRRPQVAAPVPVRNARHWQMQIALAALLVIAAIATELPAIHGPFQWDDLPHISLNPTLVAPDALWQTWTNPHSNIQYYPLSITAFWLEYQAFGLQNLVGYHLVNFLVHGLNAVLVWQLLKKLRLPWPWLAALCFAIHPLLVESIAYISELRNLLSGSLCLLAALAWFHSQPPARSRYLLALVAFAAAMLCKSTACVLPLALVLVEFWRSGRLSRRVVLACLPLLAVALALGIVFIRMEHSQVGASGPEFDFSPLDRLLIAGRAIVFYAAKLLLPINLVAIYPRWRINAAEVTQYLYPLAVLVTVIVLFFLRHRLTRGPLVAAGLFILTLAPALGFISFYPMRYSFVADHYCYLAAIPFFALAISILHTLAARATKLPHAQIALAIILAVLLAPLTLLQAARWRSESALWEPTVAVNPDSWAARENLAYGYLNENRPNDARLQAQASLAINDRNSRAHFTLAIALLHLRDPAAAIPHFRAGLELEPSDTVAAFDYALALEQTGDLSQAEQAYRRVTELDPRQARAWNNLAGLLLRRGDWPDARQAAGRAVGVDPEYGPARVNFGIILRHAGEFSRAAEQLQAGLARVPENPRVRLELARALASAGNVQAALNQYDQIVREAPALIDAQTERAQLLSRVTAPKP